jgi:hypothetical protein
MTAWAISIPDTITSSHPKNNVDATVAVTDRAMAAMPKTTNPLPNAKTHPNIGRSLSSAWIFPIVMPFERGLDP